MNELLFFLLGLVIGDLSGITMMCILHINTISKLNRPINRKYDNDKNDETCEKEK